MGPSIIGAYVAPSVNKAHRASPSRELCSLNTCSLISVFLIFTLVPSTPRTLVYYWGLRLPSAWVVAPLFLPYIRWTFVHYAHSEVRCARTSVFPTMLAGFTRTKGQDSVHSSFVPALNLFQGDRPSCFGSFLYPSTTRTLEPWFIIFLFLPDLLRQPLPLLPFSDLPGSSFV